MSARTLAGAPLAARIRADTATAARKLLASGTRPRLSVVTATADEASAWYVRSIARSAAKVEVECDVLDLGPGARREEIEYALERLSGDPAVHGIILQTPLPPGVPAVDVAGAIDPAKDVDGASPLSLGRLVAGQEAFAPATAEAVLALLDQHAVDLSGRHAVGVGRSTVGGKPVAQLLLDRDATVTVCHSRTADLAAHTRNADVLVVAAGRRAMVTAEHVRAGAIVIDVGTNPDRDGGIAGDVDAASVRPVADGLSPVPGGVGPVTAILLLAHTVAAAASSGGRWR